MKGSKVYVLMETDYNTEGDTAVISEILSVCEDLEHAKKVMQEEMQRNITQAIDTMSAKSLVKLIDSLNKVDDIYSNNLTETQKEKEWDKIERLFQKEIQRNEKKH